MTMVSVFAACKSYKKTLDNFEILTEQFQKVIYDKELGQCCVSTIKTKKFILLGEIIEISISPTQAEYIIGKVEFNLIIDPQSKSVQKQELMTLYIDSSGACSLNLSESKSFKGIFSIEEPGEVETYVTKAVLKNFLAHFGIDTY